MTLSLHQFPVVDLRESRSATFPHEVVDGLRSQGFLAVRGHRATRALMDEAEELTARLFIDFEAELLERVFGRPQLFRQRGPSPFLMERAAAQFGQERPPPDVKMFWMVRDEEWPENPADNPYGPNVWPDALLPRFKPVMLELMAAYKEVFTILLRAIAMGYGLHDEKLVNMARGAETILRPIFYPGYARLRQMGIEIPDGSQRSAPHGDINALTVLRGRGRVCGRCSTAGG